MLQSSFGQGFFLARPEAARRLAATSHRLPESYVGPVGLIPHAGPPIPPLTKEQFRANPSRGRDAKPGVSYGCEMAQPPELIPSPLCGTEATPT